MNYIDRKSFMYGGADDFGYGVDAGIGSNISSGPGGGDPNPGGGGVSPGSDNFPTYQAPEKKGIIDALGDRFSSGARTIGDIYNRFSPIQNIGRGIRGLFDKFADLRGFNEDGSRRTQDEYEKDRQDRINQNRISNILGREAPFTQMTLDNLSRLGYDGPMGQDLIGTTNAIRSGSSDRFDNNFITQDIEKGIVENDPLTFREYFNQNPLYRGISTAKDLGVSVGDNITMQNPSYNFRDAMEEINLQRGTTGRNEGQLVAGLNVIEQQAYDTLKGIVDAVGPDMLNDKQKEQLEQLEQKKNESNLGLGTFVV